MKKIIILGTYPSTLDSKNVLSECIDNLALSGYDLMIVSHLPVPEDIQSNVNVCLYDKENPLLSYSQTPSWEFFSTNFKVVIYTQGHTVAVSSNIMNGVELAYRMGYEFFYYMEADNLMHPDDIVQMETLREAMFLTERALILFNPMDDDCTSYETLIFGGVPKYFLRYAKLPRNLKELTDLNVSLERILYRNLHQYQKNFMVIDLPTKKFFSRSNINVITHNYLTEVIGVEGSDNLLLWIQNHPSNPNPIYVTVNDSPEFQLMPDTWNFSYVNSDLMVRIENGNQVEVKKFSLSEKSIKEYRMKGKITFK